MKKIAKGNWNKGKISFKKWKSNMKKRKRSNLNKLKNKGKSNRRKSKTNRKRWSNVNKNILTNKDKNSSKKSKNKTRQKRMPKNSKERKRILKRWNKNSNNLTISK